MAIIRRTFVSVHDRAKSSKPLNDAAMRYLHGAYEELCGESKVDRAFRQSRRTKPVTGLGQSIGTMSADDLRRTLKEIGLLQGSERFKKGELVRFFTSILLAPENDYLGYVASFGSASLRGLRRVLQAGGTLELDPGQLEAQSEAIIPAFPVLNLYFYQGKFTYVVPDELRVRLADIDWEARLSKADAMDRVLAALSLAVEVRGVVTFDEEVPRILRHLGVDLTVEEVRLETMISASVNRHEFVPYVLDETPYLIHVDLAWFLVGSEQHAYDSAGEDDIRDILGMQEGFEPRPITDEMLEAGDLVSWVARTDVAQELLAFFESLAADAQPAQAKESVANYLLYDSVALARDGAGQKGYMGLLYDWHLELPDDQLEYVMGLFAALSLHVPSWDDNGWSPLEQLREDRRRQHPGPSAPPSRPSAPQGRLFSLDPLDGSVPAERGEDEGAEVLQFKPASSVAGPAAQESGVGGERDGAPASVLPLTDEDADQFLDSLRDMEERCKEYERQNGDYLDEFEYWLRVSGLSEKTVTGHLNNVEFFLMHYLVNHEAAPMEEGPRFLDDFLGNWFIRKAMWSSPSAIQRMSVSLKKFYSCMCQLGHVSEEDEAEVFAVVGERLPIWKATCDRYDNGDFSDFI